MRKANETPKYTIAEFFCGCGGTSHGFFRSGGFRVVLGNDIKKAALRTFVKNHSVGKWIPETIEGDIRSVPIEQIEAALERQGVKKGQLDCLVGGPPCQGFSQMRRSQDRLQDGLVRFKGYDRLDEDPRNDLVLRFLEIANALQPKIIIIENVPQMLKHGHNGVLGGLAENVKSILQEMGYLVDVDVLNAADYGVPQLRERSFFFASRIGKVIFPKPTHTNPEEKQAGLLPWNTVADALSDLPSSPSRTEVLAGGQVRHYVKLRKLSTYAQLMQSKVQFPSNHITRSYRQEVLNIIKIMKPGETWNSACERMQKKYDKLIKNYIGNHSTEGKTISPNTAKSRLIKDGLINPVFYRQYYWSAYTRLAWDRPALTITANCNFLGSGRFTHPEQDRGITMREAARLQSFDDDFTFITSEKKDDTTGIGIGMDMIGEAVPPLLGEAFARSAIVMLSKTTVDNEAEVPLNRQVSSYKLTHETRQVF